MGMGQMHMVIFGMSTRDETPSAIMPWEWPSVVQSVDEQVMFDLHMIIQFSLEGRDWLRRTHPWGSHWFIQLWEPSPNDTLEEV